MFHAVLIFIKPDIVRRTIDCYDLHLKKQLPNYVPCTMAPRLPPLVELQYTSILQLQAELGIRFPNADFSG